MTRAPAAEIADVEQAQEAIETVRAASLGWRAGGIMLEIANAMGVVLTALDAATARAEEKQAEIDQLSDMTGRQLLHIREAQQRIDAATAEAARLREALQTATDYILQLPVPTHGATAVLQKINAQIGYMMTRKHERLRDILKLDTALAPTPPAVATVAPEGPSEAQGWLSDVLRAARETVDAWPAWKRAEIEAEVQASLDRLAGRGRA